MVRVIRAFARAALVAGVAAGVASVAARAQQAPPMQVKTVLVLFAEDITRPWTQQLAEGLRTAIHASDPSVAIYTEFLDGVQFDRSGYREEWRGWLRQKYLGKPVDLIASVGRQGVEFLAAGNGDPWPGVPVVWGEAGGLREDVGSRLVATDGVSYERSILPVVQTIQSILPDTRRVALIYGASQLERDRFGSFAAEVHRQIPALEIIDLGGLTMADLLQRVANLPEQTIIINLAMQVDAAGRSFAPMEPCRLIAEAASGPLFSLPTHEMGCGVVGGRLRSMKRMGEILGELVVRYAAGERRGVVNVPLEDYSELVFDARQLERWSISESRLPAGSRVEFQPPSLWRDHRPAVVVTAVSGAVMLTLIAVLFELRRRARQAEIEARQHLVAAAHLNRRSTMGELAASIAHELNQPLGAILHNAEAADMALDAPDISRHELREILADIRRDDNRAAEIIRRLGGLLRNREIEMRPVEVSALVRETVEMVTPTARSRGVGIELHFAAGDATAQGDRVHLQQVLLNLLLNSIDAMAAIPPGQRHLIVRTSQEAEEVAVFVTDAGCGIPFDAVTRIFEPFYTTKAQGMGMGLSLARSIVEAHGGHVGARNNPERGATVWFTLPARAA